MTCKNCKGKVIKVNALYNTTQTDINTHYFLNVVPHNKKLKVNVNLLNLKPTHQLTTCFFQCFQVFLIEGLLYITHFK